MENNRKKYEIIKNKKAVHTSSNDINWFEYCKRNEIPFVRINQKTKYSDILLITDSLYDTYNYILMNNKGMIERNIKEIWERYQQQQKTRISVVSAYNLPSFKQVENNAALELAAELFDYYMGLIGKS